MLLNFDPIHYHVRMNWQALLAPDIQNFIRANEKSDVAALALKKPPEEGWPYPLILSQIKARKKALKKMPTWLEAEGVIFPPVDLIEQASSSACSTYKASLVQGAHFVDLTAGSGMDCFAFAKNFNAGIAIERDADSAAILSHNARVLGFESKLKIHHGMAQDFVKEMPETDFVFIDPQRRNEERRGIYDLSSSSPDIVALLAFLKTKAKLMMLKTSPVLDIHKTIADLGCVSAVQIVQLEGECKELLFLMDFEKSIEPQDVPITAVALDSDGAPSLSLSFSALEEAKAQSPYSAPLRYLYEPAPAFQKSGAFKIMATRFGLNKLHPNTHLYTGDKLEEAFPGRIFEVQAICSVQKKELKDILPAMKANLSVRNFSLSPDELRKKLGIKDGGKTTLFACDTLESGNILIQCVKT